ncbi:hypothetical protein BLNAU_22627 [Blattamonas nauphoetae]|uniref:Uncharacterized protein n=1 Tax=Blattamonas nauphoetae TaxID=2049346 RepID=A0ABQ9WVK8_9EUKA|nr:hypothetical protein BLNAU_24433 [Blattamonas nauphoetae]KAK2942461.1 hypothetical protein BLNAU_22627 [Blattamonas nauphoetae]
MPNWNYTGLTDPKGSLRRSGPRWHSATLVLNTDPEQHRKSKPRHAIHESFKPLIQNLHKFEQEHKAIMVTFQLDKGPLDAFYETYTEFPNLHEFENDINIWKERKRQIIVEKPSKIFEFAAKKKEFQDRIAVDDTNGIIGEFRNDFKMHWAEGKRLLVGFELSGLEQREYGDLTTTTKDLDDLSFLWGQKAEWQRLWDQWQTGQFNNLNGKGNKDVLVGRRGDCPRSPAHDIWCCGGVAERAGNNHATDCPAQEEHNTAPIQQKILLTNLAQMLSQSRMSTLNRLKLMMLITIESSHPSRWHDGARLGDDSTDPSVSQRVHKSSHSLGSSTPRTRCPCRNCLASTT